MKKIPEFYAMLFACATVLWAAAADTNYWQAADGSYSGKWSETKHWSLGHVPSEGEYVAIDPTRDTTTSAKFTIDVDGDYTTGVFVVGDPGNTSRKIDVTFTGSGSVRCMGGKVQNVFRICTAITFDGPDFYLMGNAGMLNYSPITVKNGSTLYGEAHLTMWRGNNYLTVDQGGKVDVGGLNYFNAADRWILVNAGGSFVCRGNYAPDSSSLSATWKAGLLIHGGDVRIEDTMSLMRAAAYVEMTAGSLYLAKKPTVCSMEQFQITGGMLYYGFNLLQDESDPYYVLAQGRLGGCAVFSATNGLTFTSHEPFHVSQIKVADHVNPAHIDCDTLVFNGNGWPFGWEGSGTRSVHLHGPTAIYTNGRDLGGFNNHPLPCHGKITVHTEDWSNAETKRLVAIRGFSSEDGSLDLVVTGGGTFKFGQCYSYDTMRSCTVEEGTALQLGDRDVQLGNTTEWGPLVAETLILAKNVTVAFTAGEQHIAASSWNIDPSVKITVTIPTTYTSKDIAFSSGGFPILQDLDSKALPDTLLSQITLTGATEGWSLVNEYGQISIVKQDMSLLGTFGDFEWIGGALDNNWSTTANWNGGTPVESTNHCFGVSENHIPVFDFAKSTRGGTTLGSIEFEECAGRSFFIDAMRQATYSGSPSVKSYSRVPQMIATGHREIGDRILASYAGGPIVFTGKTYNGTGNAFNWTCNSSYPYTFGYVGDIRMGCGSDHVKAIFPNENRLHFPAWRSCLTVISGGNLNLVKQNKDFAYANTTFRVSKGGTMSFAAVSGASYKWTQIPASIVVDGSLTIGPVLYGGKKQVYRGSGTIELAGGATPNSSSSRVKFADALTVKLSSDWQTATSGNAAIALALGVTAGAPTLRVPTAWTYGAASDVTPTSVASARAFAIENGATAILDPQGGTATLNEAVSGEGTLAITNGTLLVTGMIDATVGLMAETGATFVLTGAKTVKALVARAGSTVSFAKGACLTVADDAELTDATVDFSSAVNAKWTHVMTVGGKVTGLTLPEKFPMKTVALADGTTEIYVKRITGDVIIFR